ncbi:class II aldolase/adducin family protein [bacterium]|nr:class II aldolase/adducin family protein [bacterium]
MEKDSLQLRQEIIKACLHLSEIGQFIGTWGNISVRVEEGFVITPSAVDYTTMTPEDFVVVSMDGQKVSGQAVPSSETELHRRLLAIRPDLGAFVHTHAPYATCLACAHKSLPVIVEDMAQIIGGEVRCTRYASGGRSKDLSEEACAVIGDDSSAVLLANHGAVIGGRTLGEAVTACRILEKAAFIYISAAAIGGAHPIPEECIIEERNRLLYRYGIEDVTNLSPTE